jgi:ribosomal protein L37AE/L43A
MLSNNRKWQERSYPAANLSNSPSDTKKQKGRRAMARIDFGYLPHENPCAQCGKPIAAPGWIEAGPRRTSYLWHCRACDYKFEAVAFFNDSEPDREALAA